MRGLVSGVVGCTALAMGGCTMVDSYRGLDGAPGDYVSGTSQFQRVMSGINPMSDYNSQWVLVRVVAPAGATRCWVADKSPFAVWQKKGATTMEARAAKQVDALLGKHQVEPLPADCLGASGLQVR